MPNKNDSLMEYYKEFFNSLSSKRGLNESLRENDLEHLVSPYVSIDQYTSKVSADNITVAFFCNEREVANDLFDFLEKLYYIEIRDIEIASTLTEDNKYILYVELDRNQQFPTLIIDIIDSINFLINKKINDWSFITLNMNKKKEVSLHALKRYVRLTPLVEGGKDSEEDKEENNIKKETVEYSKNKFKRTYLDEGVISEEEFSKILDKEDLDDDLYSLDKEVLEYNFPNDEIIMTESNAFIIKNNEIHKLSFMD